MPCPAAAAIAVDKKFARARLYTGFVKAYLEDIYGLLSNSRVWSTGRAFGGLSTGSCGEAVTATFDYSSFNCRGSLAKLSRGLTDLLRHHSGCHKQRAAILSAFEAHGCPE
jgi:hypothetical protein